MKRSLPLLFLRSASRSLNRKIDNVSDSVVKDNFTGSSQIAYTSPPVHPTLKPSMLRPTLFAIACAGSAFVWAANETNIDTENREEAARQTGSIVLKRRVSDIDLAMSRRAEMLENAKSFLSKQLGSHPDLQSTKTRVLTLATEW